MSFIDTQTQVFGYSQKWVYSNMHRGVKHPQADITPKGPDILISQNGGDDGKFWGEELALDKKDLCRNAERNAFVT